jgi:DNA polymerase-3 subunit beta
MKFTCKREDLLSKLELTVRVTTRQHTLAVLQCVYIHATKSGIELQATNLELGVSATLPGKVEEVGAAAVPATIFLNTITLLKHPTITLTVEGGSLTIATGESTTKIKTLPHDEFPTITKTNTNTKTLKGKLLAAGLKTTLFAVSQSSIKPELGSVYVTQKKPHTLTFVATDSFRLVEKTAAIEGAGFDEPLLIPNKNAVEISRILESLDEDPHYVHSENQLILSFPSGVYVSSRLTEGNFPDYEQIIPKEYETHATILVGDLIQALKKTNIFTNKFLQVSVVVDKDKKQLTLRSENTDAGTTEEVVPATVTGPTLTLSFNQQYLTDPLGHISDESVSLAFAGMGRPMVLSGVNDTTFRYLVMPMNK